MSEEQAATMPAPSQPTLPPGYLAREKRFHDAIALRKPDRVPFATLADLFVTRYAGLSHDVAMYDYEKAAEAFKYTTAKLNWDIAPMPFTIFPGPIMDMLGLKTFRWPGRHYGGHLIYQFVENEYMQADEYDEFLKDPGDFIVRKMLPRMATTLEPLGMLPQLTWFTSGYTLILLFSTFMGHPQMQEMLQKLMELGQEMNKYNAIQAKLQEEVTQMGYPIATAAFTEAPFDWISDMFRGLRGVMLDMYRQPDKLKAAMEVVTPFLIDSAIGAAQQTGNTRVFIPLHRGSGGFMSNQQFEEFYWPGLKQLMLTLIDNGLTPMPFLEGDYTPRLHYLAELPPGKIAGHFDIVDLHEAKKVIGDVMCFWGNIPAQTLVTGTPQQIKDYVKKLIDIFGDNGGLAIDGAVGGLPPETKPENAEAITEAVFEYGVYS